MGRIARVIEFSRAALGSVKAGRVRFDAGTEVKVAPVYAPSGLDSAPLPNDYAATVSTPSTGGEVVVGFADSVEGVAQPGEARIYARDGSGGVVCSVYLKSNGDVVINGLTIGSDGSITTAGTIQAAGITDTVTTVTLNTHSHSALGAAPTPGT